MRDMVTTSSKLLQKIVTGTKDAWTHVVKSQITFLNRFGSIMETLLDIVHTELEEKPMSGSQLQFIKNTVILQRVPAGSGSIMDQSGWYTELFWKGKSQAMNHLPVIADIHSGANTSIQ